MRLGLAAAVIALMGSSVDAHAETLPVIRAHILEVPAAPAPPPRVLPSSLAPAILARPRTTALFEEDFESATIPGTRWNSFDTNHASGDDYWGVVSYADGHPVHWGFQSAYCAAHTNRTDGRYDNDMNAVLVNRGPIYTDGGDLVIRFYYWLDTQPDADYLYMDTSSDSLSWVSTTLLTGHLGGWSYEEVVVTGAPRLWLRFVFASDPATTTTGAYVDDIQVMGSQPAGPDLAWVTPPGWSSPMVLSRYPGGHVELSPNADVSTYFDLAIANVGGSPCPPSRSRVEVDGVALFQVETPVIYPGTIAVVDDIARTVSGAGYHTVEGLADADQQAPEGNELNNSEFRVVYFAPPPRPDLRFRSITVSPEVALPGEAVTVTAVLENAGDAYSLISRIGFYWNRATPPPPGAPPDSTAIVDNLLVGEQRTYRVTRVGPVDAAQPIYMRADVFNFEKESNEDNNLAGPGYIRSPSLRLWARDLGTGSQVGLRWTQFPGVTYRVERGDMPSPGSFTPRATTADTTWIDAGLETHVPHRYRVSALRSGQTAATSFETIAAPRLPLVLVHGAMIFSRDFLSYWVDSLAYWQNWRFMLGDPAAPAARFEHVWTPRLPRQAAIEESEGMLSDYIDARMDGLARWNQEEFGVSARPRQLLAIGHSAGGLYLRRLMHRRHGLVARLVMVATPNGGTPLAYPLIMAMHQPVFVIADPLHGCLGRTLICQCTPLYAQLIFNRQIHRDPTPGARYDGVAGNGGALSRPLFLGQENDLVVAVNSVYDRAVFPQDYARHVVPLTHNPIRHDAATLANQVYPLLTDRPWGYPLPPAAGLEGARDIAMPSAAAWSMVEAVADSALTGVPLTRTFSRRGGAPTRFSVMDLDGAEVDLSVRAPSGVVYDSARAAVDPSCAFVRWEEDTFIAGKSIAIDPAAPGEWRATVTVRSAMAAPSAFVVAVEESSAVSLTLDPDALEARMLDPVTFRARLDSAGAAVPGTQASIELMAPDGSRRGTTLFDDGAHADGPAGDGWFGGGLTAIGPTGVYSVLVTATGPSFVRRVVGTLVVGESDLVPPAVHVIKPNDPRDVLFPDASYPVQWSSADSAGVDSVALWFSLEDGSAHVPIASGLPASGQYAWRIPNTLVGHFGRVHAVAFDHALNAGEDVSDFPIPVTEVVGQAPPGPPQFGLRLLSGNPASGRVVLEASASERGAGNLDVFDLSGRRVRRLLSGTFDPGSRRVVWALDRDDGTAVGTGIYWVRWRCGHRTQTRAVVVLR